MASEYGWAKAEILEGVYLDEAYRYIIQIKRRKNLEYRVQLAIVQNPHSEKPEELWDILNGADDNNKNEELDKGAFEMLKDKMRANPKIIVKG